MATAINTFGGIMTRPVGNPLRSLAGILAVFLAATFVTGYALDLKSVGKSSGKNKATQNAKTEKSTAGETELKKGLAAWEDEEFEAAVKFFRAAAEKGNSDAMIMLAHCLMKGIGTDKDEDAFSAWIKKAVDTGNPYAQAYYGILLDEEKKEEEAIPYLEKSAKQGCSVGLLMLGVFYIDNDKEEEGFEYLMKVARMPLTEEKTVIDYTSEEDVLELFDGKKGSFSNAMIYLAQYYAGIAYWGGLGVEADQDEGLKWMRKAAEGGLKRARKTLEKRDSLAAKDAEDDDDEMDVEEANKPTFFHQQVINLQEQAKKNREQAQTMKQQLAQSQAKYEQFMKQMREMQSSMPQQMPMYGMPGGSFDMSSPYGTPLSNDFWMSPSMYETPGMPFDIQSMYDFQMPDDLWELIFEKDDEAIEKWERLDKEEQEFFRKMKNAKGRKARTEMFIQAKDQVQALRSLDTEEARLFYYTVRRAIMAFRHSIDPAQKADEWVRLQDEYFKKYEKEMVNLAIQQMNFLNDLMYKAHLESEELEQEYIKRQKRIDDEMNRKVKCPRCGEEYYVNYSSSCPKCSVPDYTFTP